MLVQEQLSKKSRLPFVEILFNFNFFILKRNFATSCSLFCLHKQLQEHCVDDLFSHLLSRMCERFDYKPLSQMSSMWKAV